MKLLSIILLIYLSAYSSDVYKVKNDYYSLKYDCQGKNLFISIYKVEAIADNNITKEYFIGEDKECPNGAKWINNELILSYPTKQFKDITKLIKKYNADLNKEN